jgi:hypothetical protein
VDGILAVIGVSKISIGVKLMTRIGAMKVDGIISIK